jgi:type II secretory pathway component GspD/PulD (secretin)
MKIVCRLVCCVLACILSVPLAPAAVPGEPDAKQAASGRRADYNFRSAPIEEVFDMLSRTEKVNIILTKGVTGHVTLTLYSATLKEAIEAIARAAGYAVEMVNGDYIVKVKAPEPEPPVATQIRTLKVQYSDTRQIAEILTKYASRHGKITPLIGRKVIVVEDQPAHVERIEKLLEQLDVRPKQVMIEAKILEVTLDESEQYGVDWKRIFGSATAGTSGFASGSAEAPRPGFFFSLLNSRLELFLSALATKGRVRTLATPKLLALENQEAKAVIGDSTGYKVTTTINLVTTESVQFLESGVILKVIPSVDQRGRVMLKVHPEVSSATLSLGIPSKKSTEVTTELICEDGQSIFIGGLIKSGTTQQRDAVPLLGNIPVLGYLFSNTTQTVSASETVVIITPHVMKEAQDADGLSEAALKSVVETDAAILKLEQDMTPRTPRLP